MEIIEISVADVPMVQADLVRIYRAVFSLPPYSETEDDFAAFSERLPAGAAASGFRCFIARRAGQVVGFTYGLNWDPESLWQQCVTGAAGWRDLPLHETYFVVELAVVPAMQRQGVGRALLDRLVTAVPHPRAVLTTPAVESPATQLFVSSGWQVLCSDFHCEHMRAPYLIMTRARGVPLQVFDDWADPRSANFDPDRVEHEAFVRAFEQLRREGHLPSQRALLPARAYRHSDDDFAERNVNSWRPY